MKILKIFLLLLALITLTTYNSGEFNSHLAKKKIGIWHDYKSKFLKQFRKNKIFKKLDKEKFFNNLNNIGYCISVKKKFFQTKTLKAFQRHYRKELINGLLDKECLIIAQNLRKKL